MQPSAKPIRGRGRRGTPNPRALAAQALVPIIWQGRFLDHALDKTLGELPASQQQLSPLIQELCYGVTRWAVQLQALAGWLLERPLRTKDRDVLALLLTGLYQLRHMHIKPFAAVNETVEASAALGKPWAKNLLNACLRSFLAQRDVLEQRLQHDPALAANLPDWLLDQLHQAWPDNWHQVVAASNARPPMVLRVNRLQNSRDTYLKALAEAGLTAHPLAETPCGVWLDPPQSVGALPGFHQGRVSVQDGAAQLAALLLDLKPGQRVLDACAAPGGKTGHLLEQQPGLASVTAVDIDPLRVTRIHDNLKRLGITATVLTGDASDPAGWHNGQIYDRILLDAPCSATGVIRRHPDIRLHRTPEQLAALTVTQARMLDALWPLLVRGGKLLYVTCSILPVENDHQVMAFLARHADAHESPLRLVTEETNEHTMPLTLGHARPAGRQLLPGEHGLDGFYYACIEKT